VPVTSASLDGAAISAALAGAYCDDGHVGLRRPSFWDAGEGQVLGCLGNGEGGGVYGWVEGLG
jgi:hypothetical protein